MKGNGLFGFFLSAGIFAFTFSLQQKHRQKHRLCSGNWRTTTGASVYGVEAGMSTKPAGLAAGAPSQPSNSRHGLRDWLQGTKNTKRRTEPRRLRTRNRSDVWELKPWAAGSQWGRLSNIHRQFEGQQPCEPPEPVVWIASCKESCSFWLSCPCRTTFRMSSIFCLCERHACGHGEGQGAIARWTSAPDTSHKEGEALRADCCANGQNYRQQQGQQSVSQLGSVPLSDPDRLQSLSPVLSPITGIGFSQLSSIPDTPSPLRQTTMGTSDTGMSSQSDYETNTIILSAV
jgi:hypothetical protein